MNVLHQFTKRSLSRNRTRTLVTLIGVIISTAMITAVPTLFVSFLNMLWTDAIQSGGNWHAAIQDVPAAQVQLLKEEKGVDAWILARDPGSAYLDGSNNPMKPYVYLREYTAEGFDQMSIRLIDGRLPQQAGEVLISEGIWRSAGVSTGIGDILTLDIGQRIQATGEEINENAPMFFAPDAGGIRQPTESLDVVESRQMTVVGIMERPSFEYSWSAGYGLAGYLDTATLTDADTVDVYLTVPHINRNIFPFVVGLAETLGVEESQIDFHTELLRYHGAEQNDNLYGFLVGFAGVLLLLIVVASVALIYNAFAISVSERSRQLGLLSSVGATRRQKRASIYYEGLVIGLISIPAGIFAGLAGTGITLTAIRPLVDSFFNTTTAVRLDLVVTPAAIALAACMSALTILISLYIPARRASRISPIDAIRMTQDVKLTRKAVRTPGLIRRLFGFESELALKNLKRSRRKYRATILSLAISLVLFLTVSTYAEMSTGLQTATETGVNFDILIQPDSSTATELLFSRIAGLDAVTQHTVTTDVRGTVQVDREQLSEQALLFRDPSESEPFQHTVLIRALDPTSLSSFASAVGTTPDALDEGDTLRGILINYGQSDYSSDRSLLVRVAGDILTVRPGETLPFRPDGAGADSEVSVSVAAVTGERPMGTAIQSLFSSTLIVSESGLERLLSSLPHGRSADGTTLYLTTEDDQMLERQVSEQLAAIGQGGAYVFNVQGQARAERNLGIFLGIFIYGFISLISLICIANIFNTISTNIALRRREFAMLRSVGTTPQGLHRMIRYESLFYGIKALLYGVPVSVGIAYLLHRMEQDVLYTAFTLPWKSYVLAGILIFVVIFTTMLYATARIRKENILDALRDENL